MIIKRILSAAAFVIFTVFLVAFILVNRQMVALTLVPFWIKSESFTYHAPFFIWLFLFFGFGLLLGSFIYWIAYHKCKKALKKATMSSRN
ncbi:putative membrane protein [Bartonella vinsonii subsp. berkhoffii str. Tweed]|uniref:Putative membrane protein n=1 Tax=Bartonella vinsonii subsp. berkhoffii str. Tweed TaxID=1094502 RepID=N6VQX5_BARVB|nr:putative membrane protein [Bartonella vinsonii subsp. berkhoffii str. Tweed]